MASGIRVDMKPLTRGLNDLAQRQVPYARTLMLNDLARQAAKAENEGARETFDRPTPFTERAFTFTPAAKARPVSVVLAKDIQASYLAPFGDEGDHRQVLGPKRGVLTPKAIPLNAYGNLPKGKIAALKGRPDVFIGAVKTKSGVINGVWQRQTQAQRNRRRRKVGLPAQPMGGLKLLIRFTDPVEVHGRLHFAERAERVVRAAAPAAWTSAWAKAWTTRR